MRSHKKTVALLSLIIVGMFGFGYLMVPLYNVLCKSLGINGKTGGKTSLAYGDIDKSRTITIQFLATRNAGMAWEFRPHTTTLRLHPGENKRIAYFARNPTDKTMTVQAIPSVTPGRAAKYLKKTECFCFTQQTMKGHEAMDWPLLFHIDNSLPKDIHTITLAYTLFDLGKTQIKIKPKKTPGRIS